MFYYAITVQLNNCFIRDDDPYRRCGLFVQDFLDRFSDKIEDFECTFEKTSAQKISTWHIHGIIMTRKRITKYRLQQIYKGTHIALNRLETRDDFIRWRNYCNKDVKELWQLIKRIPPPDFIEDVVTSHTIISSSVSPSNRYSYPEFDVRRYRKCIIF